MSGVTSKSVKNWLQYWRNSDYSLCRGMGFLPLDSWDHVTLIYTGLAAASSIQGREVGRVRYTHPWTCHVFTFGVFGGTTHHVSQSFLPDVCIRRSLTRNGGINNGGDVHSRSPVTNKFWSNYQKCWAGNRVFYNLLAIQGCQHCQLCFSSAIKNQLVQVFILKM